MRSTHNKSNTWTHKSLFTSFIDPKMHKKTLKDSLHKKLTAVYIRNTFNQKAREETRRWRKGRRKKHLETFPTSKRFTPNQNVVTNACVSDYNVQFKTNDVDYSLRFKMRPELVVSGSRLRRCANERGVRFIVCFSHFGNRDDKEAPRLYSSLTAESGVSGAGGVIYNRNIKLWHH